MSLPASQMNPVDMTDYLDDWLADKEANPPELVDIIGRSPALALDVFTAVNCRHARVADGVDRLDQALILLGSTGLRELLHNPCPANPFRIHAGHRLVTRSVNVAQAASLIARAANVSLEREVFAAGLFLDIGTLLLQDKAALPHAEAVRQAQNAGHCTVEYERLLLGTDHAEESETYLRGAGFPPYMATSVLFHHDPLNAPRRIRFRAMILFLGDYIASRGEAHSGASEASRRLRSQIITHLRLSQQTIDGLSHTIQEHLSPEKDVADE